MEQSLLRTPAHFSSRPRLGCNCACNVFEKQCEWPGYISDVSFCAEVRLKLLLLRASSICRRTPAHLLFVFFDRQPSRTFASTSATLKKNCKANAVPQRPYMAVAITNSKRERWRGDRRLVGQENCETLMCSAGRDSSSASRPGDTELPFAFRHWMRLTFLSICTRPPSHIPRGSPQRWR